MTLPADTILAVAGIVAGLGGLSWFAYEWAAFQFDLANDPLSHWTDGDWPTVPGDFEAFHSTSVTEERQRDHAA